MNELNELIRTETAKGNNTLWSAELWALKDLRKSHADTFEERFLVYAGNDGFSLAEIASYYGNIAPEVYSPEDRLVSIASSERFAKRYGTRLVNHLLG